ncbi:hypothetical protein HanXRQr2_Chr16g0746331 [Helianthus annuus]|uniref:Uncharacterized protein n=1 Tax=Helianthus annuus TaxID=4232 RepID=A0A9K3GY10_HELAN|nr:hypothetical protein HanXRQr2_Chr16g0746331 [Helianthus annuus]
MIYTLISISSLNTFWFLILKPCHHQLEFLIYFILKLKKKKSRLSSSVINSGEQSPTQFSVPSIL